MWLSSDHSKSRNIRNRRRSRMFLFHRDVFHLLFKPIFFCEFFRSKTTVNYTSVVGWQIVNALSLFSLRCMRSPDSPLSNFFQKGFYRRNMPKSVPICNFPKYSYSFRCKITDWNSFIKVSTDSYIIYL